MLEQPNGVTFTGRIWGDEFFFWAETEAGYRFIQSGDGYFYYAQLDQSGEFTPTIYKVGIDAPSPSSYQLERTQARIAEINQQIGDFNEQISLNRQWYTQKQAEADAQSQPSVNLRIGIILIEFQDVKHYRDTIPPTNRPNGYFKSDFENMMFSENYWIGSGSNSPHPEEEEVFGSFKDYWLEMSKGQLRIGGQVVNPDTTGDGVPEWIKADSTRLFYSNLPWLDQTLANETIQKAIALGYISENPTDTNYYDKYAIIYAQYAIEAGGIMVNGDVIGGRYHLIAERSGPNLFGGNLSEKSFTHVGIYAHEFGHNIGFLDEYGGSIDGNDPSDLKYFCLMARGIYNGPDRKSACPATLSPWWRIAYGWLPEPTSIAADTENFLIEYDYDNPKLYKIVPVGLAPNMHYLLEIKKRQGFDSYIPEPPGTFQNQSGTLLIWQHNVSNSYGYSDRIRIKTADFSSTPQSQLEDFFPATNYQNYQSLNDTTYPMASVGVDFEEWYPELIIPAHFAINGIQKLSNGNTIIGSIKPNNAITKNQLQGYSEFVSVPVGLSSYTLTSVFPTALSAFKFNPLYGYQQVSSLNNGSGYWVSFSSQNQDIIHTGLVLQNLEISILKGWNLVGTITDKIKLSTVCFHPSSIIERVWSYTSNAGYSIMTEGEYLMPGVGYWFETNDAGAATLTRFGNPCELPKVTSETSIDLTLMDKFIVADAEGNSQSLYVVNTDIDSSLDSVVVNLPPIFPDVYFDSRYESGEFINKVSAINGTVDLDILVQAVSFPITLSWELNPANGIQYSFIGDSGLGKISGIESKSGTTIFKSLANKKIELFATANSNNLTQQLPEDYSLLQCYPNPFNPSTTIKYAIKNDGIVSLKIYNAIGEEIRTLINEYKLAGNYETEFNAGNLPSGVYIYKLQAGEFVNSKKMILLK